MSASKFWSAEEDAVLRAGFARGLTSGQLANKLKGRSRSAVKSRIRLIGLAADILCRCEECQRGDALPVRLHGIPHARQLRLDAVPPPGLGMVDAGFDEPEDIEPDVFNDEQIGMEL